MACAGPAGDSCQQQRRTGRRPRTLPGPADEPSAVESNGPSWKSQERSPSERSNFRSPTPVPLWVEIAGICGTDVDGRSDGGQAGSPVFVASGSGFAAVGISRAICRTAVTLAVIPGDVG